MTQIVREPPKGGKVRGIVAKADGKDIAIEAKKGHYYRVQGPTFLMEYDNTQNDANHIHAVWRDFDHDFGDDLLRQHYEQVAHPE